MFGCFKSSKLSVLLLSFLLQKLCVSDDETTEESATAAVEAAMDRAKDEIVDDLLEDIDVSAAFATANASNGKSVMLSMADVPDISAHDAKQIVQMFADELAETITGLSELKRRLNEWGFQLAVDFFFCMSSSA